MINYSTVINQFTILPHLCYYQQYFLGYWSPLTFVISWLRNKKASRTQARIISVIFWFERNTKIRMWIKAVKSLLHKICLDKTWVHLSTKNEMSNSCDRKSYPQTTGKLWLHMLIWHTAMEANWNSLSSVCARILA